jgi:signal transduction histidine kinase
MLPPVMEDAAIGAGIFLIGGVALLLPGDNTFVPPPQRPLAVVILTVEALAVALRRRNLPIAYVLMMLTSATGLFTANEYWGTLLTQLVLLYTVSERCGLAVSLLALAADQVISVVSQWFTVVGGIKAADYGGLADVALPYTALVWFAGRAQRRRRALASDLERSVDELREERDRLARSAIAAERTRIGRELRDVVVRSVERMRERAHVARADLGRATVARGSQLIGEVEVTGRRALAEMRRLLQVLRSQQEATVPIQDATIAGATQAFAQGDAGLAGFGSPDDPRRRGLTSLLQRVGSTAAIPWVTDLLVVLVMAILFLGERLYDPYWLQQGPTGPLLALLVVIALLLRRIAPISVLVLIASVMFVQIAFLGGESNTSDRALFVAVFTVAALRGPLWGLAAVGAEAIAFAPYPLGAIPHSCGVACFVGWTTLFAYAVVAGLGVRESRLLNRQLQEQKEELRRTREERVRLAVGEERTRIARDVHDMVGHGVTLMVIQAGAARWLAEADPAKASDALLAVESAGEQALDELEALFSEPGPMGGNGDHPLPTGTELEIRSLVDEAAAARMRVDFVVRGEPHALAPGLELSLYRIVQETLTNVRKHAPGAAVRIELHYTPDGIEVEVTDGGGRGHGSSSQVPGAGQGLVGIAERAALYGGRSESGRTPDGGFRVWATMTEEHVSV